MKRVNVRVASRPPRLVFICSSNEEISKSVEVSSKLWGGLFNLILRKEDFIALKTALSYDHIVVQAIPVEEFGDVREGEILTMQKLICMNPPFLATEEIALSSTPPIKPSLLQEDEWKKDPNRASFYFGFSPDDPRGKDERFLSISHFLQKKVSRNFPTPIQLSSIFLYPNIVEKPFRTSGIFVAKGPLSQDDLLRAWNLRASGFQLEIFYYEELLPLKDTIKKYLENATKLVGMNQDISVEPLVLAPNSEFDYILKVLGSSDERVAIAIADTDAVLHELLIKAKFATTKFQEAPAYIDNHSIEIDKNPFPIELRSVDVVGFVLQIPTSNFGVGDFVFYPPEVSMREQAYFSVIDVDARHRIHEDCITLFEMGFKKSTKVYINSFQDFWKKFFKKSHSLHLELSQPGKNMIKIISALGGLQSGCRILKIPAARQLIYALQDNTSLSYSSAQSKVNEHWSRDSLEFGLHMFTKEKFVGEMCSRGILKQGHILVCSECNNKAWYPLGSISQIWSCEFCDHRQRTPLLLDSSLGFKANGLFQIAGGAQGALVSILALWRFSGSTDSMQFLPSFVLKDDSGEMVLECDLLVSLWRVDGKNEVIVFENKTSGKIEQKDYQQIARLKEMLDISVIYVAFSFSRIEGLQHSKIELKAFVEKHPNTILFGPDELDRYDIEGCFNDEKSYRLGGLDEIAAASHRKYLE